MMLFQQFLVVTLICLLLISGCAEDSGTDSETTKSSATNSASSFTSSGTSQTLTTNTEYSITVLATDADGDNVTYSASTLPSWLSFNLATGNLSGTPYWMEVGDSISVTITASDGTSSTTNNFTLTVKDADVSAGAASRFLVQSTYGPTTQLIADVTADGIVAWLNDQLALPSAYDDPNDSNKSHLQRVIEIAKMSEPSLNTATYSDYVNRVTIYNSDTPRTHARKYQMAAWWENSLKGTDQLRQRVAYALSQILVTSETATPLDWRGESLAYT